MRPLLRAYDLRRRRVPFPGHETLGRGFGASS
jgi:hypothetical protein